MLTHKSLSQSWPWKTNKHQMETPRNSKNNPLDVLKQLSQNQKLLRSRVHVDSTHEKEIIVIWALKFWWELIRHTSDKGLLKRWELYRPQHGRSRWSRNTLSIFNYYVIVIQKHEPKKQIFKLKTRKPRSPIFIIFGNFAIIYRNPRKPIAGGERGCENVFTSRPRCRKKMVKLFLNHTEFKM